MEMGVFIDTGRRAYCPYTYLSRSCLRLFTYYAYWRVVYFGDLFCEPYGLLGAEFHAVRRFAVQAFSYNVFSCAATGSCPMYVLIQCNRVDGEPYSGIELLLVRWQAYGANMRGGEPEAPTRRGSQGSCIENEDGKRGAVNDNRGLGWRRTRVRLNWMTVRGTTEWDGHVKLSQNGPGRPGLRCSERTRAAEREDDRTGEQPDGRTVERAGDRTGGRSDRKTDGRPDGWTARRKDGSTGRREDGRATGRDSDRAGGWAGDREGE